MKPKLLILLAAILSLPSAGLTLHQIFSQSTSAQKQEIRTKAKQQNTPVSPRIKRIIKGSEKPGEIPEKVAYELFLRTIAEGNARVLVKRAGFEENEIEKIMSEAYSLREILSVFDRKAFELKENKNNLSVFQLQSELTQLQEKKDFAVTRAVSRFLPGSLGKEEMTKLRDFIKTGVTGNIRKILLNDSAESKETALLKRFAKSFASKKASGNGGELYLYREAWDDGINVYGSAALSEQYSSEMSYRITVSVTSPTGRSNTTESDWNYAPLIYDTGLSIGDEDGNYLISADFEEQEGYYDEYKNFYGTGSSSIGSLNDTNQVPATVRLVNVIFTPPTIQPISSTSSNAVATVIYSRNLPNNSTVDMELNDGITTGNPLYQVNQPTVTVGNIQVHNNREITLTAPDLVANQSRSQQVIFPFSLNTNTGTGTVLANIRIGNLNVPAPISSTAPIIAASGSADANLMITAPTPIP